MEEPEILPMRQQWLLDYQNPFKKRFDPEFFKGVPKEPGIYQMLGELDEVLYVGKAKDLRARLRSYRQCHPDQSSRKVLRMLTLVRRIRWETCASEKDALLRENQLLRELKPPFNVVNTSPESYSFIGIRRVGGEVRFRLTLNPKREGDLLYGAYKGRGTILRGYPALLRLLWLCSRPPGRFEFPSRLVSYRAPNLYSVEVPDEWMPALKSFLGGRDRKLLVAIALKLLERSDQEVPRFVYHLIETDLQTCIDLFESCFRRNRDLKTRHGHKGRLIPQEKVDDLLVLEAVREGRVAE